MCLVFDVAQNAAEAEEINVTRTDTGDGGGSSNIRVKPRGGNGRVINETRATINP